MIDIVQKGADVLREKAKEIPLSDIGSPFIKGVIRSMHEALASRDDAVAIAAPQLGHPIRMFMVSKRVFIAEAGETEEKSVGAEDVVFMNPVITKRSRKKVEADEGCLSIDGWYGKTKRSEKVTLRAYDEAGDPIERGASGLLAQVFQHEVDHLNGILFDDHAIELFEISREENGSGTETPSHEK